MSGLVEGILSQLGPGGVAQLASSLGTNENQMESAVAAAIPAILAGMANNSRQPNGAEALSNALSDHSPSIFDQLGSLLGSGGGDGAKILGHVLGSRQAPVAENLSGQSGINLDVIMKLLPILAPLVMGYLSGQKKSQGLDAGGLGSVLGAERQQVEKKKPGLGGLASILDADGDGSIVDDLLGKLTD